MSNKRVPASIRNKNPGAQQPGKVSKQFGATTFQTLRWTGPDGKPKTNTIATFPTDVQGGAAMFYLLASSSYADGKRTIRAAITKWCGGYHVSTYLKVLFDKSGISGDTILTRGLVCNPEVAIPLAKAMAWQEAGQEYPMSDEDWSQAHAMALPDAVMAATPVAAVESAKPAEDAEGWDRKARSSPEARVKAAASDSWTLKGTLLMIWTAIMKFLEDTWSLFSGTFDTIQSTVGGNSALGFIASSAKVSLPEFFAIAGVVTGGIIISRRFAAAKEGKPG